MFFKSHLMGAFIKEHNMKKLIFILTTLTFSLNLFALSESAKRGKELFPACFTCHNPDLKVSMGPPAWSIQRQYKKALGSSQKIIDAIVAFAKKPSKERVIMKEPFKQLGLMQPLPLPDKMLKDIAHYMVEEKFPPPCNHWKNELAEGRADKVHEAQMKRNMKRWCK
jgi:cytochrome c551/c552